MGGTALTQKRKHFILSIGTAILSIDVVILLHFMFNKVVGDNAPLLLMLAAVAFCAWRVGRQSGVVATMLGALVSYTLFFEPKFTFKLHNSHDIFDLSVFVILGISITASLDGLNRLRKKAEIQRRSALDREQRFQLALQGSGTFVAMIDPNLRYTWAHNFDRAYPELANDIIGKSDYEIFPDDQAESLVSLKKQVLFSGIEARQTLSFYAQNKRRDFDIRVQPMLNEEGESIGLTMAANDVTIMKEAELAAEAASQAKTLFLANMSHEIRTPLGIMIGYAELMKDQSTPAMDKKNYLQTIIQNGEQLTRIINEILDVSKVESEKIEIEKVDFSLLGLLAETCSVMAFEAQEKGLRFHYVPELDESLDRVISDPTRLRQILFNIIGNAVKFTTEGNITVRVRAENLGLSSQMNLVFDVCDTGMGISTEQRDRLFKPFAQADGSMTRRFGGTGLGLYLSRKLAEALGGSLELMPENHQGSHFQIRIPVELTAASRILARTQTKDARLDGIKILLVEDSADNRHLISRYLLRAGAEVTTAVDGSRGVEAAFNFNFDVILMDLQMPVLDGYGATRTLRENNYVKPILALTAHAFTTERDRCLRSGFDEHLVKPIDRDELIATVAQFAPKRETTSLLLGIESVAQAITQ